MAHPLPSNIVSTCDSGLLYCFAKYAYDVTGGMFWTFLLAGFMIVLFIATQRFGTTRSYGFASIIGLLGSLWFATLQLMPWWVASAFILNGAIGLGAMVIGQNR